MGWTVLYIAFGIVALWLLGEVLLQYKARLRWRLLAFAGFLCVIIGVLMQSRFVIVVGTIAFAIGQTYVTLSFRRGFSTGWAIGGSPGESRRRRGGRGGRGGKARNSRRAAPTLEVSDVEAAQDGQVPAQPMADASPAAVYAPEPLPDDTGQYGVYSEHSRAARDGGLDDQARTRLQPQYAAYDGGIDPAAYPVPGQDLSTGHDTFPAGPAAAFATDQDVFAAGHPAFPSGQDAFSTGHDSLGAQNSFAGPYDYGTGGQQRYAAYSDPYIGTGTAGGPAPYDGYGDPYAQQQYAETPPGGVWVPQQREGEQYPAVPPEQPAPYPNGHHNGNGYDGEQYRY
ncbi:hypothetical protein ACFYXM_01050 [Streptomyces sp. NPDC002476]|uniref:hypothetical protein n=1 Tax=Streptomyces sp. NPDC002476 TaxID=3364648 RepID=UPI0036A4549D